MALLKRQWEPLCCWVALIGMALTVFIQQGFLQTYGLLYLDLLDLFREGPEKTGLMATIYSISGALMSLLTGWLTDLVSPRLFLAASALIACAGTVLSAFAPSMDLVIVGYGVLRGVTMAALAVVTGNLAKFFRYNRSLATGIAFASGSLGAMLYPLVYRWLVDIYSTRGVLLIFAAFDLNIMLNTFLWPQTKDLPAETSIVRTQENQAEHHRIQVRNINTRTDNTLNEGGLDGKASVITSSFNNECDAPDERNSPPVNGNENLQTSTGDTARSPEMVLSAWSLVKGHGGVPKSNPESNKSVQIGTSENISRFDKFMIIRYFLLTLFHVLYCFSYYGFLAYTPAYADEQEVNSMQQSLLLTISGIMTMLGRIVIGIMGSAKCVNIYFLTVVCFMACSATTLTLPAWVKITNPFWVMVAAVVIQGFLGGGVSSLGPQFVVDAVGVQHSTKGVAFLCVTFSVGSGIPPLLFGSLKTKTGSYGMVPVICGIAYIISAFFIVLSRCLKNLVICKSRSRVHSIS